MKQLQKEYVKGQSATSFNIWDVFRTWLRQKSPNIIQKQDCYDVIRGIGVKDDDKLRIQILEGAKLALMAYALPYFFSHITTNYHFKNSTFMSYFERLMAESTFLAYENMDSIIEGDTKLIELPDDNQLAGFYFRTPIRMWNKQGKSVFNIPKWSERMKLLNYIVVGNVNVYVLRKNLKEGFELYINFRGTSNEFNGIPQYGKSLKNTQIFRCPRFNIEEQKIEEPSDDKPLFYYYYSEMILDAKEHIYECLRQLDIDNRQCKRIVVSGHSMGGGLTITFAHLSKIEHPKWWEKFQFRTYAAPYCCNMAAVKQMEKWVIESKQPYKFIEVINTDDFVNIQYMFGGKEGLTKSIQGGTSSFLVWMTNNHLHTFTEDPDKTLIQKVMRITQIYPERSYASFLNGAIKAQIATPTVNNNVGMKMAHLPGEVKLWGTTDLTEKYSKTLNVVYCKRRIRWENEYVGKSHTSYSDVNMNIFWSPLRAYENSLYRYYSNNSLKKNNKFRIIGMFSEVDKESVTKFINTYNVPLWKPSKSVMKEFKQR